MKNQAERLQLRKGISYLSALLVSMDKGAAYDQNEYLIVLIARSNLIGKYETLCVGIDWLPTNED
ncbi:MAG: hypothetical protein JWP42_4354 [Pseudomonas sp.]|nr:hypothetical protein [Pseudomonas sp.]